MFADVLLCSRAPGPRDDSTHKKKNKKKKENEKTKNKNTNKTEKQKKKDNTNPRRTPSRKPLPQNYLHPS